MSLHSNLAFRYLQCTGAPLHWHGPGKTPVLPVLPPMAPLYRVKVSDNVDTFLLWNEESGFAPPETILTHCISSKGFDNNIFYLLLFRRESGLESFVPTSLAESMKRKELKKLLGHFLKMNSSLTAPGNYFNSILLDWIILGNS